VGQDDVEFGRKRKYPERKMKTKASAIMCFTR
jgi:hypothetical protein